MKPIALKSTKNLVVSRKKAYLCIYLNNTIMGEKINFEELRAQMPKKLNKLGEWFFSKDRTMFLEVNDMKAVLK